MAAILCESLSKILRGSCEAIGTVLTFPCKACGCATEQLTKLCRSPFCLYLTVAIGLNLPPIIFSGMAFGAGTGGSSCTSASNWLYLNGLLCLINILAAVYISAKITYEPEDDNAAPFVQASVGDHDTQAKTDATEKTILRKMMEKTPETDTRAKSFSRVKEILCYDPLVALYILVGLFYMVWQSMGIGRTHDAADCGGDLERHLSNSLMCGFMYIMFGGVMFAFSVCCLAR